jgi:hypothetical protein
MNRRGKNKVRGTPWLMMMMLSPSFGDTKMAKAEFFCSRFHVLFRKPNMLANNYISIMHHKTDLYKTGPCGIGRE